MLSLRLNCASLTRLTAGVARLSSAAATDIPILGQLYPRDQITNVTPAILDKIQRRLHLQPSHPLGILRTVIEGHYPTFTHISSLSPVVTPERNFDSLSFPADHPGRSAVDSYYINREFMLRTHTSAHQVETFTKGERRWVLTADVYRRDEIDACHYPVFHQMEGASLFYRDEASMQRLEEENACLLKDLKGENIIVEDVPCSSTTNPVQTAHERRHAELVANNLKLSLNSLMLALFGRREDEPLRVRWIEAYFPFTSPSYEVEVFFNGKWLEILGCGVVLQSILDQSNVPNSIGWAFGLGLERIAMILFGIPDIRLFWSEDPRFLSQFTANHITSFKPYSKYPPCYKDVSFWLSSVDLHENDFCDLVRDTVGDIAEDVKLIDSFTHPKTSRRSLCFRINYRSMDKSLSNDEVNRIHAGVVSSVKEHFGVEIR